VATNVELEFTMLRLALDRTGESAQQDQRPL
jgi:hypothetical protein